MIRLRIPGLHPRRVTLSRYADRTLGADAMRRSSVHLIGCTPCRDDLEQIKQLRDMVRAERVPVASSAMLERVLARRQAGERVILPIPVADIPKQLAVGPWHAMAAAVVVIAIGGAAVLSSRNATAASDDGELLFTPAHPQAGAQIEVVYRPSERFANDTLLMLRGRFVGAPRDVPPGFEKRPPSLERFAMRRGADGAFRTRFVLPSNVVYSAFAIEDAGALRLDSHRGRPWELLAYGEAERPRFDALLAATRERGGWDARHDAARELVAAYPDSIAAWQTLAFAAGVVHGESDSASIAKSRAALERFESTARNSNNVPRETTVNLYYLARTLHDSARADYWKQRALREWPRSPLATQLRGVEAIERRRPDPNALARALPELDRIWREVGAVDPSFTTFGLQSAIAAADPVAIARWGRRYRDMTHEAPSSVQWVGSELVKYPQWRQEGLALLRSILAPSDVVSDTRRGLRQAANDRQREVDELRAATLQSIGEALLADNHHAAALDSLRLAARVGWNLARFRAIAAAALSAGDTVDAMQMLALVSLDPATAPSFVDTARTMIGANVTDPTWQSVVTRSETMMRDRVLAMSTRTPLRGNRVRLSSAAGEKRTFAELAEGHTTVVAFGADLLGGGSPVDLAAMERLSVALQSDSARLVVIALHPRAADMAEVIRKRGLAVNVVFDEYHEADRAFSAYGFPIYFVVDAAGSIRFRYSDVGEVRAQVRVLAQEKRLAQRLP